MPRLRNPRGFGNTVTGHVLDVRKEPLLKIMQDYDPQLYLKWNPDKKQGYGMWEIRRRPNQKTQVYKTTWGDTHIFELQYVESDLTHHILDVEYLNYHIMTRLKEMDTWQDKYYLDTFEYEGDRALAAAKAKERQERKYLIKEEKKYLTELREMFRSGINPLQFLK